MTTRSQTTCAHEMAQPLALALLNPPLPLQSLLPSRLNDVNVLKFLYRNASSARQNQNCQGSARSKSPLPPRTGISAQANKKHKIGASNPTDPKNITPATRVKEFPGEYLSARSGKLFCTICHEELALKKSTVKKRIESGDKHQKAKKTVAQKKAKEHDTAESLKAYDKEVQPAGTHISRGSIEQELLKGSFELAFP